MPKLQNGQVPKLRLHKPSGRGVVTLSGKDHYCGPFGSPETTTEYQRLIGLWLSGNKRPLGPTTAGRWSIATLCDRYLEYAASYYRHNGELSSRYRQTRLILGELKKSHGEVAADSFGPTDLRKLRDGWSARLARTSVVSYVSTIKTLFKWAVGEGGVAPETASGVSMLMIPTRGPGSGRATPRRNPVNERDFQATLNFCTPVVQSIIRLLWLTGARWGEIRVFRPQDCEKGTGDLEGVSLFRPSTHKRSWAGESRIVVLGPQALSVLHPHLSIPGSRPFGLSPTALNNSITRACDEARVPRWSPHQVRHAAATRIAASYGVEAARVVLGHRVGNPTTSIYAERDIALAAKVMREVG